VESVFVCERRTNVRPRSKEKEEAKSLAIARGLLEFVPMPVNLHDGHSLAVDVSKREVAKGDPGTIGKLADGPDKL